MVDDLDSGRNAVDQQRRSALQRMLAGAAFAVPLVASYGMSGMSPAHAQASSNQISSNQPTSNQPVAVPTLTETATLGLAVGLAGLGVLSATKGSLKS